MPLQKNTDCCLHRLRRNRPNTMNSDATANANLAARLPYLFATCRFAHYLKCIARQDTFQRSDATLVAGLILTASTDPAHSTEPRRLRSASITPPLIVEDVEGNPGTTTPGSTCARTTSLKG